jgi:hypothetical protein
VRVARALALLPVTREAFSIGRLSYSKVRAITRVGVPESEADLVAMATHCTAAQLDRIASATSGAENAQRRARRAHLERCLGFSERDDGSGRITIELPAEAFALARAALEALAEELDIAEFVSEADHTPAGDPEALTNPFSARMADAFVRMCERSLDPEAERASFSERFLVQVHCELREGRATLGELAGSAPLADPVLDRILCDATVVPVLEIDGHPVHTGARTDTIPRALRRAVAARDRGCRFPGCTNTRWVDLHHVIWRSRGGPTALWNLITLCRLHHTGVHHRGIVITLVEGDYRFARPDGTEIPIVPQPPESPAGDSALLERHRQLGLEITPTTAIPAWDGQRLDAFGLDVAVEGLLKAKGLSKWN